MAKIITNGDASGKIDGTSKADTIKGLGGDDKIGGHDGKDKIDGGEGNDHMHGGPAHDILTGGDGSDLFVFKEFGKSDSDKITDFKHGADMIAFDTLYFTALNPNGLVKGEFFAGAKAHDANDHLIYNSATGNLYYDDDGNGAHKQHLIATLDDHTKLTASDIMVFFD